MNDADRRKPREAADGRSRRSAGRRRVRHTHPGAAPGTLVVPSERRPRIFLIDYAVDAVHERELGSVDECVPYLEDDLPSITWIDVRGIGHQPTFERIGEIFGIHPLALEDVVNVPQRPKTDVYPEQQVIIARMAQLAAGRELSIEQIAILFGRGFVLTVQETEKDVLEVVRERIRKGRGSIRSAGADFLAYTLLDAVIDAFYPLLERLGDELEELETAATDARKPMSGPIHAIKGDLLHVRRALWPQRELVNSLLREESPHIAKETRLYLRDTYDHAVQLMDMVETYRELASGIMDLHLSSVSNRTNEIMKVLTVISTIFLPITFIAGVYGMNFDTDASPLNMPELRWRYGYVFALAVMLASVVGLLLYYRSTGLIGAAPLRRKRRGRLLQRRNLSSTARGEGAER